MARAQFLARIGNEADVAAVLADPEWRDAPKFVLGGGSNIVLTGDVKPRGAQGRDHGPSSGRGNAARVDRRSRGRRELARDFVQWTVANGCPGLENLALIPGTVGGAPVQNIGAYGVELQDRFDSLDAIDLTTGKTFTLDAAQCAFGYRDSVFKHVAAQPGQAWA